MEMVEVTKDNVGDYVCARIFGGLGNQMFQYATAFSQAKRLNLQLLLHAVGSERLEHANFGLAEFPITAQIWDQESTRASGFLDRISGKAKRAKKHATNWPGERLNHDSLTVSDEINTIGPSTYLAGYFQSEAYFVDYADNIRQQFSLEHLEDQIDRQSLKTAGAERSVSVHIRRGDYLIDPKVLNIHGIMEDDYYELARSLMEKMVPDCQFCIFSDDLEAADRLTQNWPNRVLMPQADRLHDLALMSKCSHHIVANSSFSWWGAWLNPDSDKQVIAPRRWYTREHMKSTYIDDICPKGWLLI